MKNRPLIMIAIAVLFGAVSIFVADIWLESAVSAKVSTSAPVVEQKPTVIFNTIVVAAEPLRYGEYLSESVLKEIPWPESNLPKGAFKKIEHVLAEKNRVVLSPIEISEPVLLAKISGENGRAALSNMLGTNMRAVTIRVDDVAGVAGFITPGDRVDISLTRNNETISSQILLQNIKVLTVDQKADERSTGPELVRAVTVEVNTAQAQEIILARAIGTLSLSLRAAGDQEKTSNEIATLSDFSRKAKTSTDTKKAGLLGFLNSNDVPRQRKVIVTRGLTPTTYSVVNEAYLENEKKAE